MILRYSSVSARERLNEAKRVRALRYAALDEANRAVEVSENVVLQLTAEVQRLEAAERHNLRHDRLNPPESLDDVCECGGTREEHEDVYADQHFVGAGPCRAPGLDCQCRAGEYPKAVDEVADRKADGTW